MCEHHQIAPYGKSNIQPKLSFEPNNNLFMVKKHSMKIVLTSCNNTKTDKHFCKRLMQLLQ